MPNTLSIKKKNSDASKNRHVADFKGVDSLLTRCVRGILRLPGRKGIAFVGRGITAPDGVEELLSRAYIITGTIFGTGERPQVFAHLQEIFA